MKERKIEIDNDIFEDTYFVIYKMNREQFEQWRRALQDGK